MSEEIKNQIITAWNRYLSTQRRRYAKNEGSTTQHEDTVRMFNDGIVKHPKLSKREKEELLLRIGFVPPKNA